VGIITAKQTGYWQNNTSVKAYRQYLTGNQMPRTMPKGMDPEKMKRMTEMMEKMKPQLNKTL
ncbi:MAG: hypothetical protein QNK40_03025, partial [Desulfobacterales bacterium]|nr:hypothetical protein [Desulfobacterales bacterium]